MKSFSSEIIQSQGNWKSWHFKKKVDIVLSHQKDKEKKKECIPQIMLVIIYTVCE